MMQPRRSVDWNPEAWLGKGSTCLPIRQLHNGTRCLTREMAHGEEIKPKAVRNAVCSYRHLKEKRAEGISDVESGCACGENRPMSTSSDLPLWAYIRKSTRECLHEIEIKIKGR